MNHKLRAKGFELWATVRYKLQATRYELRALIYKFRATCQDLWCGKSCLSQLMTVQYPESYRVELFYGAKSYRIVIEFNCPGWSAPADYCTVPYRHSVTEDHQPVEARFLRSLYGDYCLQDFVNSTGKFNSMVVKTLNPVLCFSYDDVPLKFKKKTCRLCSSTVHNVSAWFQPLLNLAGQCLERVCPARCKVGLKGAQKIRTEELQNHCFF